MQEVRAMPGWTKTDGFFGALERHGLTLTKEKVGNATICRAAQAPGFFHVSAKPFWSVVGASVISVTDRKTPSGDVVHVEPLRGGKS